MDQPQEQWETVGAGYPVSAPSREAPTAAGPGRDGGRAPSILVIDDDAAMREMVARLLKSSGLHAVTAGSAEEALEELRTRDFDAVLSDIHMPGMDGLGLLAELRGLRPETPVVLMTAFGSIRSAVEAMRAGAFDYVPKPFDLDTVLAALERALDRRALEEENRRLRRAVARVSSFGDLVGRSASMNEIYAMIRRISGSRSNVLITGESGTGKEVVARTIHFSGPRAAKPFVPINCTAMPEGLLESELFGHVRGAFTGAQSAKKGLFEEAQGGTLFLDEIGDMPVSLQGKLLRVLQDRHVRPVGGNQQIRVDVRIVAASNKDLKREIERENFRKDLFYRLNVIPIHIPPLRERPEDVAVLAHSFVKKHGGDRWHLSEKAIQRLQAARWDGNARELENVVERALVLASGQEIKAADILLSDDGGSAEENLVDAVMRLALQRRLSLRELESMYVDRVLEGTGGQKSEAARILGVNRRTLYRRNQRKPAAALGDG